MLSFSLMSDTRAENSCVVHKPTFFSAVFYETGSYAEFQYVYLRNINCVDNKISHAQRNLGNDK